MQKLYLREKLCFKPEPKPASEAHITQYGSKLGGEKGHLLLAVAETIVPLVRSRKLLAEEDWVWKEFSHRKKEGEIMMRFHEKNVT